MDQLNQRVMRPTSAPTESGGQCNRQAGASRPSSSQRAWEAPLVQQNTRGTQYPDRRPLAAAELPEVTSVTTDGTPVATDEDGTETLKARPPAGECMLRTVKSLRVTVNNQGRFVGHQCACNGSHWSEARSHWVDVARQ